MADGGVEKIVERLQGQIEAATWGDDGTIVFARGGDLFRVAAAGGEPEVVVESGDGARYRQPHMLPGSEVVLFHLARSLDPEQAEIVALDLATGTQTTVLENAMDPLYVETGHLLFMRQGTLMAVAFDPKRLEVVGQPVIMVEDVMHAIYQPNTNRETGAAQVAVSSAGHLAYALGGVYPELLRTAVRVTLAGDTIPLDMERDEYIGFRVSPDGERVASHASSRGGQNIVVHDLARGVPQRLNNRIFEDQGPVWSPDGRRLAFNSPLEGVFTMYRRSADGSGDPERLTSSDLNQALWSWSSQGVLAFTQRDEDAMEGDIWVLLPDGSTERFFAAEGSERNAAFSPDGEWLAYGTLRRGRNEVWVRPYPSGEPATLITDNGSTPAWSPDGRKIYYSAEGALMAVDVTPGDEFQAGRPATLIDPWTFGMDPRGYDVFPDGSFVTAVEGEYGSLDERFRATELHVVLNWFEELKERVGN